MRVSRKVIFYTTMPASKISLLCGSQTGTAFELAEIFAFEASRWSISTDVIDLKNYSVTQLPLESIVIFFVATAGQGEAPSNMKSVWSFLLRNDLPKNSLTNLAFGVFGLGDSSYPKYYCIFPSFFAHSLIYRYNWMAKKLCQRLLDLGAKLLGGLGLGNYLAPRGHFESFVPWMQSLFSLLKDEHSVYNNELLPKFSISFADCIYGRGYSASHGFSPSTFEGRLEASCMLTSANHFQRVYELKFVIPSDEKYFPGDIVEIFSPNMTEDVDLLLKLFNWSAFADKEISIIPRRSDARIPSYLDVNFCSTFRSTFRDFLTRFLQISNTTPNQRFFYFLAAYLQGQVPDFIHEKMVELGDFLSEEGIEAYVSYCWKPRRRIVEILREFLDRPGAPLSISLDPACSFDLFSWIKPRSFSISSVFEDKNLSITFASVEFNSVAKNLGKRVGYFSSCVDLALRPPLAPKVSFPMALTRGSLKLPSNLASPVIFACAGTGIAPFLSFLDYFLTLPLLPDEFEILLIFGYRYQDRDFIHQSKIKAYKVELGSKFHLLHCGSRDIAGKKRYIDHEIIENSERIKDLLYKRNAYFYLCGNPNLPDCVKKAFLSLDIDAGQLEREGRFQVETW